MQSTTNTQSLSRPSLPVIAPLVIRKKSSAAPGSPPSNRDGAQSSPPIRTLLSRPELSKGRLPKLKIALGDDDHPEGRFGGGSYIGPPPEAVYNDDQDSTVRPSSGSSSKRESLHTLRQTSHLARTGVMKCYKNSSVWAKERVGSFMPFGILRLELSWHEKR
ncbi:hypothetical protein JAAARDRAFT_548292 [Jaapia argillacea MUCL 33604]|uniref:Uncharacterized protein n=1 Tax=Jaapia argillacea MUCL 33604 TaxID=933084 RepID=A0A067P7C3_9AGAM|nr:hypothetical protein JAAARDRAFT_548292 [Jaapia argillacea MUCL 33604]